MPMPETLSLFATHVTKSALVHKNGEALRAELLSACQELEAQDGAGRAWCRANGYMGYTSYASLADLPQRFPAFDALRRALDAHVKGFAELVAFDLGGGKLKLDSLWVNVLPRGGIHTGHIHPHSVVSGTYYVSVPDGASALKLEDPRLPQMMATPPRRSDAGLAHQTFVSLQPQEGEVILWESWLRHEVVMNTSTAKRVSISFNYAWV
ncbi:MAG: hypothetical protein RL186_1699 [Pseudomonadota bacterium]